MKIGKIAVMVIGAFGAMAGSSVMALTLDYGLSLSSRMVRPTVEVLVDATLGQMGGEGERDGIGDGIGVLKALPALSERRWRNLASLPRPLDCGRTHWGRLRVQSPFGEALPAVLVDRWLLTRRLDLYAFDASGQIVSLSSGFKNYKNSFAVPLRHARWLIHPGTSQVYFRYQCWVAGRPELEILNENDFSREATQKVTLWIGFCMSMLFAGVYGLVFYGFTRMPIDRALALVGFAGCLVFFLFLRIEGQNRLLLPNLIECDVTMFVTSCGLLMVALGYYMQTRVMARDPQKSLFAKVISGGPCLFLPVSLMIDAHDSLLLVVALLPWIFWTSTALTLRSRTYQDFVPSLLLAVIHTYGTRLIFTSPLSSEPSFWFLLWGYFVVLLIVMVDRGYHGLREFAQKTELMAQKIQNQNALVAAQGIQRHLLMGSPQSSSFACHYQPAESIGGDWYSYFFSDDERYVNIMIGDITGHGIASAYATAVVWGAMATIQKVVWTSVASPVQRLEKAARLLNRIVYQTCAPYQRSMTALLLSVDLMEGKACYFNAAHNPILLGSRGAYRTILAPGMLLGYEPEIEPQVREFAVRPGDLIFLHTDGLLELQGADGQKFKMRELGAMLKDAKTASDLCEEVRKKMDLLGASERRDDVTLLIYQVASYKLRNVG